MTENRINKFTISKFRRMVGRMMLILLSVLLACILILVGVLFAWSPGKPSPFLNENGKVLAGSISEKIYVNINGVKQGMFIKSKNKANPVLLFLHGGPGMPEYFLGEKYLSGLEDNFTVCYWEQRGSGLSYRPGMSPKTVTLEQSISDTIEVTNYLRKRFGQDKIYLVAHSYGSFLGIQVAARAPQLYRAYIGIGQMCQQYESEKEAYKYMLEYYKAVGDSSTVKKLEFYPVLNSDAAMNEYLASSLRDNAMHQAGIGTMHNMHSVITGIFLPVMQCHSYTISEKMNIWRGKGFSQNSTELKKLTLSTDLTHKVPELKLPVYFISGKYDLTVSHSLAKSYFDKLKAPVKGFYTFEHSAHSPLFEEPEKFLRIMREDVLNRTTGLADSPSAISK